MTIGPSRSPSGNVSDSAAAAGGAAGAALTAPTSTSVSDPLGHSSGYSQFGDVVIPWGGLAGCTMFAREGSVAHHWISVRHGRIDSGTSDEVGSNGRGVSSGAVPVDGGGPIMGTGWSIGGEGAPQGKAGAGPVDIALPLYGNRVARVWIDLMDPV